MVNKKELQAQHEGALQGALQKAAFHASQHQLAEVSRQQLVEHSRAALAAANEENERLQAELTQRGQTEKHLRAVAANLEQSLHTTEAELGAAREELEACGREWQLDAAAGLAGMEHLHLIHHLEGVVAAVDRWRADGDRVNAALQDCLLAAGRQLAADAEMQVGRETKGSAGTATGTGDAAAAERKAREDDLRSGLALAAEARKMMLNLGEREQEWAARALPPLRLAFAGAGFAAQQAQQLSISQEILKSPEKRQELTEMYGSIMGGGGGTGGVFTPGKRISPPRVKQQQQLLLGRPQSPSHLNSAQKEWEAPAATAEAMVRPSSSGSRGQQRPLSAASADISVGSYRSGSPTGTARRPQSAASVAHSISFADTSAVGDGGATAIIPTTPIADAEVAATVDAKETQQRGSDRRELQRQLLALQGRPDTGEEDLPPVMLLARRDTVDGDADVDELESGTITDAMMLSMMSDGRAGQLTNSSEGEGVLWLHEFAWGSASWTSTALPPPQYEATGRDKQMSVTVAGFDPTTASAAASFHSDWLVVCGEASMPGGAGGSVMTLMMFNRRNKSWIPLPPPLTHRKYPVLCALGEGRLLMMGGYDEQGSLLASVELLDLRPVLRQAGMRHASEPLRSTSAGRRRDEAASAGRGRQPTAAAAARALRWTNTGRMAHARDGFAHGELPDGRVIIAGGTHYPFGVVESGLRTAEIFNPATLVPQPFSPAPTKIGPAREKQLSIERQRAKEAREAAAKAWAKLPSMSEGHGYCAGCVTIGGRFLVSGGYDAAGAPTAIAELFDPASNSWQRIAPLCSPARDHRMCAVPGGVLLCVVGGGAVQLYDEDSNTWLRLAKEQREVEVERASTGAQEAVSTAECSSTRRYHPLLLTTI